MGEIKYRIFAGGECVAKEVPLDVVPLIVEALLRDGCYTYLEIRIKHEEG